MKKNMVDEKNLEAVSQPDIEQIVAEATTPSQAQPTTATVYFLSEVAYDSHHFEQENTKDKAYPNFLKLLKQDPDVTGVVVDGTMTRLDRPEFLNDFLTYWTKSDEECQQATETIRNRDQYRVMMEGGMNILEERLGELRKTVPKAKIVLSVESDDLQFTVKEMVNEAMIRATMELDEKIQKLKGDRNERRTKYTELKTRRAELSKQDKRKTARERGNLTRRIANLKDQMDNIDSGISEIFAEKNLYREKKVRPRHQQFTRDFIETLYAQYEELCSRVGVELITKPSCLKFGPLRFEYAHSRETDSWTVFKSRDKRLLEATMARRDLADLDAIVESGHAGIGYKQLQKLRNNPAETNFENQASFEPVIGDEHITVIEVLPFEDQEAIARYVQGEEPVRMSGGKPTNTRSHATVKRLKNGGVSGLTVLRKNAQGVLGTEWIQFQDLVTGKVLEQPPEYSVIYATSDEHLGSPEENPVIQRGIVAEYKEHLDTPTLLRGKPVYARGFISGGDTAEANSRKWNHRDHHRPPVETLLGEDLELLLSLDQKKQESVKAALMKLLGDSRAGSVEDMTVILNKVADYYDQFFRLTLDHSELKWAHLSVTGNHADGVLVDLGQKEFDYFVQRVLGREGGVYQAGTSAKYSVANKDRDTRVALGGHSNARILNIPDYGKDVDGNPLFGPVNLLLQHDPKGGGFSGLVGAGKKAWADVALAGHTHETWVKLYSIGPNQFRVAYRMATLQGVSATELYYASSPPRTQAAHRMIMPSPGHFIEETLPAPYLLTKGQADVKKLIEREIHSRE